MAAKLTYHVPELAKQALDGWADGTRLQPGGFIMAVLTNNLREAMVRADEENRYYLHNIVMYAMNRIPGNCWGDAKRVREWPDLVRASR